MDRVHIPLLKNVHGHLRQGELLKLFVPFAVRYCSHYFAMGNTKPHIANADCAERYYKEINTCVSTDLDRESFRAFPVIKIREDTKPEVVREALQRGYKLFKLYPLAKTSHADDGIANYFCDNLLGCYKEIAAGEGYSLWHPEHPGKRWDDSECEYAFLGIFEAVQKLVPELNMVWEHLTDTRVLPFLFDMGERVAATVTAHHMMLRLNDVLGQNYHLCRPPAKLMRDMETLRHIVTSAKYPRIMLGFDEDRKSVV